MFIRNVGELMPRLYGVFTLQRRCSTQVLADSPGLPLGNSHDASRMQRVQATSMATMPTMALSLVTVRVSDTPS
jgi:hypothetical protein